MENHIIWCILYFIYDAIISYDIIYIMYDDIISYIIYNNIFHHNMMKEWLKNNPPRAH